ncbi:2'-5' RNA ligase family protein [Cesiribacter sp. SM1]|uniref:2'-5' RNA ligase family protein n=1 Tax=Cesiribacter sp. SM1 TaxID=2861196 RepID=UPI001CD67298|nr:2'-5' RNA ligase family protein [Cesiribacter sp. SM1]
METNPLILTLSLDEEASAYFTALRDKHFPPERNFLKAHLTLFHKLTMERVMLQETLSELTLQQSQMLLQVAGPQSIGNGVAYKIISSELQQLHKHLQQKWQPFLSPQDKQKLRPHITIQNKVAPAVARQLQENLAESFSPFTIRGTGLSLWEYLGGPWKHYREFSFQAQPLS